jgi:hypothetical protein
MYCNCQSIFAQVSLLLSLYSTKKSISPSLRNAPRLLNKNIILYFLEITSIILNLSSRIFTVLVQKLQNIYFFPLRLAAICPAGTCKNKYPKKNMPDAIPATLDVIPNALSIPPEMAKLILTLSMKETMQMINSGGKMRLHRLLCNLLV